MTKSWQKFLLKTDEELRKKIELVLYKILNSDFNGLYIKSISGKDGYYRCRYGKIRIIFQKENNGDIIIKDIGYRGDIYKGLKNL